MPPMRCGGTRKVFIPAKLAYNNKETIPMIGAKGRDCLNNECSIPPNSPLEFTIALVNVVDKDILKRLSITDANQLRKPTPEEMRALQESGQLSTSNVKLFASSGSLVKSRFDTFLMVS